MQKMGLKYNMQNMHSKYVSEALMPCPALCATSRCTRTWLLGGAGQIPEKRKLKPLSFEFNN